MKLSEQKKAEIYDSIVEPITNLRIHMNKYGMMDYETLDQELFSIQNDIWKRIHEALKLEGSV